MKLLVVIAGLVAACSAGAVPPSAPGDNSHYVEGVSRYIWMPDDQGKDHLVDLQEPVDEEFVQAKNGANNQYWLFTRQNPNVAQILVHGNANSVWNSNYGGHRQLKVIVHGWQNNGHSPMNPQITSAFLAVQDCNVIVVDWSGLANGGYSNAVNGVPSVGQHLGNFLQWLINTAGGHWNNVHLVGFSLGAHVVGNAGRQVGGQVSRVTGLDPAGPQWGGNHLALNVQSGQYVECIHTDGRSLGIMDPIGHANFYPNGGRFPQPGCGTFSCGHGRAPEFFASSIRTNHLVGKGCVNLWEAELATCNGAHFHMGNANIHKRGHGIYGLITGSSWPY